MRVAAAAAWALLLALLPWWLGLPLLLMVVAVLLSDVERLRVHAGLLRGSLRCGLPGVALALLRWLGADALAWTVAAVAALAGFTLLAGLEAWLDRAATHEPLQREDASADVAWPESAWATPVVAGGIIELAPVCWQDDLAGVDDPRGGVVAHAADARGAAGWRFNDGTWIAGTAERIAFSPCGRWFAWRSDAGTQLWDRDRNRRYRLGRRRLYGWHDGRPWLQRGASAMPEPLQETAGTPQDAASP